MTPKDTILNNAHQLYGNGIWLVTIMTSHCHGNISIGNLHGPNNKSNINTIIIIMMCSLGLPIENIYLILHLIPDYTLLTIFP